MNALESFAHGEPLPVDVTSIERELASLWKTAASDPAGGGGPALSRACQINLIVCCAGREEARAAEELVAAITSECPSRALMVVVEDGPGDGLEASISAHCSYAPGSGRGRQVCCEQITLRGTGAGAARLPGAVLPLLLPDLPVALWYPSDPEARAPGGYARVARALADSADRVVVDSRRFPDPLREVPELAALPCAVSDLGWQRLRGWREMTASFFDGQMFESYPSRIDTVRATYAPGASGSRPGAGAAEALLLSCWAASRLRWGPDPSARRGAGSGGRFTLLHPAGNRPCSILLQADQPARRPAGQVVAFELLAGEASFTVRRSEIIDCVTATVSVPGACPIPRSARVPERGEGALLCRSLETSAPDPVHREALRLAARLAGAQQGDAA